MANADGEVGVPFKRWSSRLTRVFVQEVQAIPGQLPVAHPVIPRRIPLLFLSPSPLHQSDQLHRHLDIDMSSDN